MGGSCGTYGGEDKYIQMKTVKGKIVLMHAMENIRRVDV